MNLDKFFNIYQILLYYS